MAAAVARMKAGDVLVLHGCCHNPTGVDLDRQQWDIVTQLVSDMGILPLIDFAYQGFANGLREDADGWLRLAATRQRADRRQLLLQELRPVQRARGRHDARRSHATGGADRSQPRQDRRAHQLLQPARPRRRHRQHSPQRRGPARAVGEGSDGDARPHQQHARALRGDAEPEGRGAGTSATSHASVACSRSPA